MKPLYKFYSILGIAVTVVGAILGILSLFGPVGLFVIFLVMLFGEDE